jgi:hypothetical protein
MVGSVYRVKRFTIWSRNSLKDVRKSQMMPDQVRKWLIQQSESFCAAAVNAMIKRWGKYDDVGGRYVDKCFLPVSNITCFTFYTHK